MSPQAEQLSFYNYLSQMNLSKFQVMLFQLQKCKPICEPHCSIYSPLLQYQNKKIMHVFLQSINKFKYILSVVIEAIGSLGKVALLYFSPTVSRPFSLFQIIDCSKYVNQVQFFFSCLNTYTHISTYTRSMNLKWSSNCT